ncbi:MAG: FeoA family protein [Oscillospiraceae bacterium]
MENNVGLNLILPGEKATVICLLSTGSIRRRLLDIGLISGTCVECLGRSPQGDPTAFLIRGAVIALRCEDCKNILVCRKPAGKE